VDTLDPRAARSRDAVLVAARALLQEEGPASVTHQRVAQRACVGRATVYRHWPRPESLLQDAIAGVDLPFFAASAPDDPDDGHARAAWLRRELRRLADELALPTVARVTAALLQAAQWDADARQRLDRWLAEIDRRLRAAGIGEGSAALLVGPLVYRAVFQAAPVDDALVDRLVSVVLIPPDLPRS
jgi:AcrR family transcriptional regulator